MKKIAVLLTVYNRCNETIAGLTRLHSISSKMNEFLFDVFMVDDGCTDGTSTKVKELFPFVHILNGDGSLFWSGGMRKAWLAAMNYGHYDFFLWFNDDVWLFDDALIQMFEPIDFLGINTIVSGAFCDDVGNVSYGGKGIDDKLIIPNGSFQNIFLMNGNFVLVPACVVDQISIIDRHYYHGYGDWDYGCRARKKGVNVVLTRGYVGKCNRHDNNLFPFFSKERNLRERIHCLFSPKYSITNEFLCFRRCFGIIFAVRRFLSKIIFTFFPVLRQ